MRYIYLLLITFIFAACGNQKLRFVRVNSTKQKVVEINDIPKLKVKTETAYNNSETNEESQASESAPTSTADIEISNPDEEETMNFPEVVANNFPESVQDSTTVSEGAAQDIQNEALRAERLGTASLTLSLMFFLFAICIIIALFIAFANNFSPIGLILAIAFALLSLASLIVSIVLGAKSLNAAYNTPKGRKRAITGIIISSVALGLFLLNFTIGLF